MKPEYLLLLVPLLASLLVAALRARMAPAREEEKVPGESLTILVKGWRGSELGRILASFAQQYGHDPRRFQLQERDIGTYQIAVAGEIRGWEAAFLVNYLNYPVEFALHGRTVAAVAQFRVSESFEFATEDTYGLIANLYVPTGDEEGDQVFCQCEGGSSYQLPFSARRWTPVSSSRQSAALADLVRVAGRLRSP